VNSNKRFDVGGYPDHDVDAGICKGIFTILVGAIVRILRDQPPFLMLYRC